MFFRINKRVIYCLGHTKSNDAALIILHIRLMEFFSLIFRHWTSTSTVSTSINTGTLEIYFVLVLSTKVLKYCTFKYILLYLHIMTPIMNKLNIMNRNINKRLSVSHGLDLKKYLHEETSTFYWRIIDSIYILLIFDIETYTGTSSCF